MSEISPRFLKVKNELNKKYGDAIRKAGQGDKRRLPTEIFNIDWCLNGGIPVNRLTLIYGHKSCYKTFLALKAIKSYQSRCNFCFDLISECKCGGNFTIVHGSEKLVVNNPMTVIYIDNEHALDEDHAVRLGINIDNLYILDPPNGEAACEYAEKFSQVPEVGLIIIDSLAGLVPERELESGYFDKVAQSLRARLIARMYRALITHLRKGSGYPPRIAIALNHLLPNRDGYGHILPGGETQKYLSSVAIMLQIVRKQYIKVTNKGEEEIEEEKDDSEQDRHKKGLTDEEDSKVRRQPVRFVIEHSKVSPDLMRGEFEIFLGEQEGIEFGDTNDFRTVAFRAVKAGLIEKVSKEIVYSWINDRTAYEKVKQAIIRAKLNETAS